MGSTSEACNLYDGQCTCKDGFGGRQCDQCEENYWGDPREQCYPCDCNPQGSQSFQCDWKTGKCVCLEGTLPGSNIKYNVRTSDLLQEISREVCF